MEGAHGAGLLVDEQDREAVSRENTQYDTGNVGDHAVTGEQATLAGRDHVNHVGVYLAQGHQRPERRSLRFHTSCGPNRAEKKLAVLRDVDARIARARVLGTLVAFANAGFRESQVQAVAAESRGDAARARAESVNQPGGFFQVRGREDLWFTRNSFALGRFILNKLVP